MTPLFTIQEAPLAKIAVRYVNPGEFFIVEVGSTKEIHLRLPDDYPADEMGGKIVALHFGKEPRYLRFPEQTEVTVTRSEITLYKQSPIWHD